MEIFEKLGVLKYLQKLLSPFLILLGISDRASNIILIGLTIGISYGGALLIDESKTGKLNKTDISYSIIFISLCHAIIEDSILMLTVGTDFVFITLGRFIFTFTFIAILNYINKKLSKEFFIIERNSY